MTYSRYVLKIERWKLETVRRTGMFTIVQNDLDSALVLLSYRLVNYTVWKFRSLIMKIFKTECLLNSKLPNTHACSSATQEFCPNPLLWVVISEKTCNKLIFSCFTGVWPYFSPTKYYKKLLNQFYDEIAF